ncbi:MAG: DUF5372 family protein [Acidobacteriota bacterium]
MTHPCHSLSGREVEFLQGPRTCSDRTVLVELPGGERRQLPRAWTSLAEPDPYTILSAPPRLRLEAMRELVDWVCCRQATDSTPETPKRSDGGFDVRGLAC